MRHRRLYRSPRGGPHPHRGPPPARIPGLRLRRDRPRRRGRATCSSRRRRASSPTSRTAIADRTPHAALGLAHTRWATHGRPNDLNAHPHQDCTGDITVIHNGIIENFRELRDGLEAPGPRPDLRDGHRGDRPPRRGGVRGRPRRRGAGALRRVEGAYALVVMHKGEISRLVGARQNVPLVVGLNGEESFIASDVVRDPRPHQPGRVPRGGRHRRRPAHRASRSPTSTAPRCSAPVTIIDWTPEAAEKGGYEHFMLKEIHEQPDALRQSLAGRVTADGRIHAPEVDSLDDGVPPGDPGRARRVRHGLVRGAGRRGRDPGLDRAAGAGHRRAPSSATRRRRSTRTRSSSP